MLVLESPKSIIHAGIYCLTENATTCMVIFHIGIYGIIYSATVLACLAERPNSIFQNIEVTYTALICG